MQYLYFNVGMSNYQIRENINIKNKFYNKLNIGSNESKRIFWEKYLEKDWFKYKYKYKFTDGVVFKGKNEKQKINSRKWKVCYIWRLMNGVVFA